MNGFVKNEEKVINNYIEDLRKLTSDPSLKVSINPNDVMDEFIKNITIGDQINGVEFKLSNKSCFTSCLEYLMDRNDIPDFARINEGTWFSQAQNWLSLQGLRLCYIHEDIIDVIDLKSDSYYICVGYSDTGGPERHAVVYKGTDLIFDSLPEGKGLVVIEEAYAIKANQGG